jgi:hypothetical protein
MKSQLAAHDFHGRVAEGVCARFGSASPAFGLATEKSLLPHPKAGASWEGFVIALRGASKVLSVALATHVKTSPYYPQSSGKIERNNQTAKVTPIRALDSPAVAVPRRSCLPSQSGNEQHNAAYDHRARHPRRYRMRLLGGYLQVADLQHVPPSDNTAPLQQQKTTDNCKCNSAQYQTPHINSGQI